MFLVPSNGTASWRVRLADPDKQWKPGCSAFELAARWEASRGFPPEVTDLLSQHEESRGPRMLLGIPEHRVPLAGGARASQTDLWVLARTKVALFSIVVEGKVDESFGPGVGDSDAAASPGRSARWAAVCRLLEITQDCDLTIRYQLLHRTASALLEAHRFHASAAAVIVHSFSPVHHSFSDFQQFVRLLGGDIRKPGEMVSVPRRESVQLYFGWASAPLAQLA